ncbi:MAG: tetratricopeptide repeat protein [Myxococcota bacterium]|nr:tetratricopeptide repeat protein [Myxococcota bacterium]
MARIWTIGAALAFAFITLGSGGEGGAEPRPPEVRTSGPVLPPTASGPLLRLLKADDAKLGGRLVLQSADIRRTEVEVRYGKTRDGDATLVALLRHPQVSDGAVAVGPAFSLHRGESPAEDRDLRALAERLKDVSPEGLWLTPPPPEIPEPEAAAPTEDPDVARARDLIRLALHALAIDNKSRAIEELRTLSEEDGVRRAAGLELSEIWWRVDDKGEARKAVAAWRKDQPPGPGSPVDAARARVLSGLPATTGQLGAAIEGRCDADSLGRSLDAVGRRPEAHLLMQALVDSKGCLAPGLQRIAWLVEERRMEEADKLSLALRKSHPDSDEASGRRAQVLMALSRPQEAVELLEELAWADPDSGLLSSLLGAYNRVPDESWQIAKRAEIVAKADANPDDHVAAFFAGVLLHYGGEFAASDKRLKPLLKSLGNQPRLFIYLGMNAFNQKRTEEAMDYIARAEALEAPDPDVYYCRAELLRWSDPPASLADLDRYLAQTRNSPTSNDRKRQRVQDMRDRLAVCVADEGPIPCPGPWEHPYGHPANLSMADLVPEAQGPGPLPWAGVVVLGIIVTVLGLRRRRRRAE